MKTVVVIIIAVIIQGCNINNGGKIFFSYYFS